MRLLISDLRAVASERPPGYIDALISAGQPDGEWLDIPEEKLRETQQRFGLEPTIQEPSMWDMAIHFTAGVARWAGQGFPTVTAEEHQTRTLTCAACEHYKPMLAWHGCGVCGCSRLKLHLATERCPLGKWSPPSSCSPTATERQQSR